MNSPCDQRSSRGKAVFQYSDFPEPSIRVNRSAVDSTGQSRRRRGSKEYNAGKILKKFDAPPEVRGTITLGNIFQTQTSKTP